MLPEAAGPDLADVERLDSEDRHAVAGEEDVDRVARTATAVFATSIPSATRVGFSRPVAICTSNRPIACPPSDSEAVSPCRTPPTQRMPSASAVSASNVAPSSESTRIATTSSFQSSRYSRSRRGRPGPREDRRLREALRYAGHVTGTSQPRHVPTGRTRPGSSAGGRRGLDRPARRLGPPAARSRPLIFLDLRDRHGITQVVIDKADARAHAVASRRSSSW